MSEGCLIVSPDFPPKVGGLSDHTRLLASELAQYFPTGVLTSEGCSDATANYSVYPVIGNWKQSDQLLGALCDCLTGAAILWQYVPHMYGRGGMNFAIPRIAAKAKRLGVRQLMIAHEIAGPWSAWPHRWIYALAQRIQWRCLRRAVSEIGVSTERWLVRWCRERPGRGFARSFFCPSPSNIPVVGEGSGIRNAFRKDLGFGSEYQVLGYFGTVSAGKQIDWVISAWKAAREGKRPVALVMAGQGLDRVPALDGMADARCLGFLSPEATSRMLSSLDVLALPFVDGVSERRGSFMAGLEHGCAIVTTRGHNTGPTLNGMRAAVLVDSTDQNGFVQAVGALLDTPEQRRCLGDRATQCYRLQYSWDVLVEALTARISRVD